jgi:hypothetical protein
MTGHERLGSGGRRSPSRRATRPADAPDSVEWAAARTGREVPRRPAVAPARTGVCTIRVQVQSAGVWCRVVMNPDVLDPRGDRIQDLADLRETLQLVRDFLATFEPPGPP